MCAPSAWAQEPGDPDPNKPINVLNTDVLEFEERDGIRIRKLIGNVILEQDSTLFYCDVAYQYEDSNKVDAQGHVRVMMTDSVTLNADRMIYFGNTKIVELYNNIILRQPPNTLTTNRMTYYRIPAYAVYVNHGTLRDTANTLTSVRGHYYTRTRTALFGERVRLVGTDFRLRADSLVYNSRSRVSYFVSPTHITTSDSARMYTEGGFYDGREGYGIFFQGPPWYQDNTYYLRGDTIYYNDSLDYGWAHCNITALNTDSTLFLGGDTAHFFRRTNEVYMADHPYMIQYMEDDTLVMMADTLYAIDDSINNQRLLRAWHDVRIHLRGMQSVCDSAVFNRTDSIFQFLQTPYLWSEANQITGDTIRVFLKNEQVDSLEVIGRAFVISEELPGEFYNQARGRSLYASLDSNKISYLKFVGNAESMYFNQEDSQYVGMNHATSIDMEVFLANNRPQRIRFLQTPRGKYYPIHEVIGQTNQLEGYNWAPELRPRNYLDSTGWDFTPDSLLRFRPRDTMQLGVTDNDSLPGPSIFEPDSAHPDHDHSGHHHPPGDSSHSTIDSMGTLRPQPVVGPSDSAARPVLPELADTTIARLQNTPRKDLTPEERIALRKALKKKRFEAKTAKKKARVLRRYKRENARRLIKRQRKAERLARRPVPVPVPTSENEPIEDTLPETPADE